MTSDTIFYTQIASNVAFLISIFTLYRLLIDQKDSVIQLLKERMTDKDARIQEFETQTRDATTSALSLRIEVALKEISRLREDGGKHQNELGQKETELLALKGRLSSLSALIAVSDLICNKCGSRLGQRVFHTIHGEVAGHEVEADVQYIEYECGRSLQDGSERSPCAQQRLSTAKRSSPVKVLRLFRRRPFR